MDARHPLSNVRTYGYDAASRLTSRQDAKSQTTTYTYNDRNELTNVTYPDTTYVSYAYNDSGAQTQMVDETGTTSYSYDSLYRLTGVTFPGSRTVSYGYDDASRRTSITYPGGSNQVTYAYDSANRLSTVTDWNSKQTSYAYDDANRMTSATLPNGVVGTSTYDNANRLTGISWDKSGTTLASASYTVDAVGNRSDRTDLAGTQTYSYDNDYRLTSVVYPGPTTTSYTYDAFGNRATMTDAGGTTNYSYDDAGRLTTVTPPSPASAISYTWDNNGDLTARGSDSFGWDFEDRMTSATVGGASYTYTYRGDGLRNSATTGGVTTTFTWDINAGLPQVLDDGSQYVYGAGLISQVAGGSTYYYLADGLGSVMKTTDSTGAVVNAYTYDVYGKTTASPGSQANDREFAGQQTDPTGLQYLRARYYDPATGGFLARDPLSASAGWAGSPFGYGGASPANAVDPTGTRLCGGAGDEGCEGPPNQGCSSYTYRIGACRAGSWNGSAQDVAARLNKEVKHADGSAFANLNGSVNFCSDVGKKSNSRTISMGGGEYAGSCRGLAMNDLDPNLSCTSHWIHSYYDNSFGTVAGTCANQFGAAVAQYAYSLDSSGAHQCGVQAIESLINGSITAALVAGYTWSVAGAVAGIPTAGISLGVSCALGETYVEIFP